jgi:DNA (cytosine-5)-methyltransferase 1
VDIITGGSPCQDLSVAGKRAGLAGERSGLFMEQMRIVKEMRDYDRIFNDRDGVDIRPRFLVWENVPGAFSSGDVKGADFQAVLQEVCRVVCPEAPAVPIPAKGWPTAGCLSGMGDCGVPFTVAWRVHDAQFWGVAQRRRRISLVADFGGLSAPEILFERESVSGDSEPRGEAGQGTPARTESGAGVASTITATYGTKWNGNAGAYNGGNFVLNGVRD